MYNSDLPARAELPSSKQLAASTLVAAGVAALLLVTAILPAEYGIDPTGIGRTLGLTQMGEIKVSLAQEAAQETTPQAPPLQTTAAAVNPSATGAVKKSTQSSIAPQDSIQIQSPVTPSLATPTESNKLPSISAQPLPEQRTFRLKPGEAVELKLAMLKGAKVTYQWTTTGGHVNFDTHGDNATTSYYGYGKGRKVTTDEGELVAAFDGNHGWFWRNRSAGVVTVTLTVRGDYLAIKRMV